MVERQLGDLGVACGPGGPPHNGSASVSTKYAQICSTGVNFGDSATLMSRTVCARRMAVRKRQELHLVVRRRQNECYVPSHLT